MQRRCVAPSSGTCCDGKCIHYTSLRAVLAARRSCIRRKVLRFQARFPQVDSANRGRSLYGSPAGRAVMRGSLAANHINNFHDNCHIPLPSTQTTDKGALRRAVLSTNVGTNVYAKSGRATGSGRPSNSLCRCCAAVWKVCAALRWSSTCHRTCRSQTLHLCLPSV